MSEDILKNYMENNTKEVALPSNPEIKFTIRKIPMRRAILKCKQSGFYTNEQLNKLNEIQSQSHDKLSNDKIQKENITSFIMNLEINLETANSIIKEGVINPKVTDEFLNSLTDQDWNFLHEQTNPMIQKEVQDSLQNFRKEENASDVGQFSKKIQ